MFYYFTLNVLCYLKVFHQAVNKGIKSTDRKFFSTYHSGISFPQIR